MKLKIQSPIFSRLEDNDAIGGKLINFWAIYFERGKLNLGVFYFNPNWYQVSDRADLPPL